jgi:hypothetical protein
MTLARVSLEVGDQARDLVLGRPAVTLAAVTHQAQALKRDAAEVDRFDLHRQAVHGGGVLDHELDEAHIDPDGCGPGALAHALTPKLNDPLAIKVVDADPTQLTLEGEKRGLLGTPRRLPHLAHVGDVQVHQVAEGTDAFDAARLRVSPRSISRSRSTAQSWAS